MAQRIEHARPPGRNDPCPCGSGKKYKRCCLIHEAIHAPVLTVEDVVAEVAAAEEEGKSDEAIQILREARGSLRNPELDDMLVERYLTLPPQEAESSLRAWWEEERDRWSGAALAQVLVDLARKDEALQVLDDSRGSDARPDYWRLLSSLREDRGETEAAVTAMELYARLVPQDADAWMRLADMQSRLGQRDRALVSLRRASDAEPDTILPRILRLRLLSREGRWREVRDLGEALLEGEYEDSTDEILYDLRDLLAGAYVVFGDSAAARRLWDDLLCERPEDSEVRHQLAMLEFAEGRFRRTLLVLDGDPSGLEDVRTLDTRLRCLLALREWEAAEETALQIEAMGGGRVVPLVYASQGTAGGEWVWALDQLAGDPPEAYRDLWYNLRLDCLARLSRWQEILPTLKSLAQPDDAILRRAAACALGAGKLDLAERLLDEIEDQQSPEVRALSSLLPPLRQVKRAAEERRQQQVDDAEKRRWAAESRDLRRRLRELERQNEALAEALAGREAALERLLERVGVSAQGGVPIDWEAQIHHMAERAHKDALAQQLAEAEQRLRGMLGDACWERLSENSRAALREGEWLFAAVEGEDRDYGAALLEYARGLERAFKDSIFGPIRRRWERQPDSAGHLHDEGLDPYLGPFVRYVLQGDSRLTLGSMAMALERMSDGRRQGVAVTLLRRQLDINPLDARALADWRRTSEQLSLAAEARNQPAHAGAVNRDSVRHFREIVLGTGGLIRALG